MISAFWAGVLVGGTMIPCLAVLGLFVFVLLTKGDR
jgi:hypothetical protein